MSTPSWLRPAERAAPQVSANARGPAIGQIMPLPAFDAGGSGTGSGSFGASAVGAGSGWGATATGAGAAAGAAAGRSRAGGRRCGSGGRGIVRSRTVRHDGVGRSDRGRLFRVGGGLGGDRRLPRLALAIEFLLHRLVDQALLLHLGQMDDLGFGRRLQVGETLLRRIGLTLPRLEVGPPGIDLVGHGGEVVERDRGVATRDAAQEIRGDLVVGVIEVDQQRKGRRPRLGERPDRLGREFGAHRRGLRLDRREFLLGVDDLDAQLVDFGLGVEHPLRRFVGAVARRLDLARRLGGGAGFGRGRARCGNGAEDDRRQRDGGRDEQTTQERRSLQCSVRRHGSQGYLDITVR